MVSNKTIKKGIKVQLKAIFKLLKINKTKDKRDADIFSNIVLKNPTGKDVLLEEKWNDKTVLLKVLPRLGCCLCRHEVLMLKRLQPILDEKKIHLVAVAFEDIDLTDFLNGYWDWDILLDVERKVYHAAGLVKLSENELSNQMNNKPFKWIDEYIMNMLKVKDSGNGDFKQLGGMFIIKPDKSIIYEFKPNKLALFPCIKEICQVIGADENDIEDDVPSSFIVKSKYLRKSPSKSSSHNSDESK